MATIRKRTNRKGTVWQIDYYDPQGKRVMKCFSLKKDAEAYLGKVQAAKREGRYHDVFDVKREPQINFNAIADRYSVCGELWKSTVFCRFQAPCD